MIHHATIYIRPLQRNLSMENVRQSSTFLLCLSFEYLIAVTDLSNQYVDCYFNLLSSINLKIQMFLSNQSLFQCLLSVVLVIYVIVSTIRKWIIQLLKLDPWHLAITVENNFLSHKSGPTVMPVQGNALNLKHAIFTLCSFFPLVQCWCMFFYIISSNHNYLFLNQPGYQCRGLLWNFVFEYFILRKGKLSSI